MTDLEANYTHYTCELPVQVGGDVDNSTVPRMVRSGQVRLVGDAEGVAVVTSAICSPAIMMTVGARAKTHPFGGPREFARGRVLGQDSGQTIEPKIYYNVLTIEYIKTI